MRCPHCDLDIDWHGVPEYKAHQDACARIEMGLIVGQLPAPDDLVPEVAQKPKGWGWSK